MTSIARMIEHEIDADDGVLLAAEEHGPADGEAVLLVHGWPDTGACWRYQVPALVDAGYRVVVYDQRGFGRSGRPETVAGYHVFNAMTDIGVILDHLGIDRAHLVGHDWGSPPCWLATMFAPERVISLTALSAGHPRAFRTAGWEQKQRSFYMLLFQFDIAEQWLSMDGWANARELVGHTDEWPRMQAELEIDGALTSSLNWYRANMAPSTLVEQPPNLPRVTRPTFGIMGSEDCALTEHQMLDSEQYVDAEWRYERIEGATHWISTDTPNELNALLLDWLGSNPAD